MEHLCAHSAGGKLESEEQNRRERATRSIVTRALHFVVQWRVVQQDPIEAAARSFA